MAAHKFTLLGVLNIENNGQPSPLLGSSRGCALLAYLILTRQPQSREVVADLLWESSTTAQSLTRLRVLLSRLRKWLPEEVGVTRQAIVFQGKKTTFVDLYALLESLAATDWHEVDDALKLYKGDLLADFYVADAPRFNEWLLLERERLRQQVLAAYRKVCVACAEAEEWSEGAAVAQRWLVLDDLDEAAVRWLMQLLAGNGQVGAALQAYDNLGQRLEQELGVEPEPDTAELAAYLLAEAEGRDWSKMVTVKPWQPDPLPERGSLPAAGLLPPQAYLPYQRNDDFRGREASLKQLAAYLLPWSESEAKLSRAVAITGMGGLGKTQLAVEFAYRYGRYYEGGVYWLSFADGENVAAEVAVVGGERGMRLYRDADKLTQTDQVSRVQRAWQEATPRLLIFDNCEEEALLEQWLPVSGGCRVLLTSRRGEWTRELRVTAHKLNTFTRAESVALLQQLAPEAVAQARPQVEKIAAELGDLPLALHLAGSFLGRYQRITPQQYLAQLNQLGVLRHPSLLGRGSTYSPTGHELNVARTFAINFEQLNPHDETDAFARKLLFCTACFAPGEPIPNDLLLATAPNGEDEVEDLMAELLAADGLARLVALGFVRAEGQETVVMHRLVAQYIKEVLEDDGAQMAVENKIIEVAMEQSLGTWALASQRFPPVHLRYIMEQALARQDLNSARLVNLWGYYLGDIGDFEAAEQQLLAAQKIEQQILGADQPETAEGLFQLGRLYIRMGNYQQSKANYEQYLAFWEQVPEPDMIKIARVLYALGTLYIGLGDFDLAQSHLQRALVLRERHLGPDHPHTSFTLINLGALYSNHGDLEKARVMFERALKVIEASLGELSPEMAIIYDGLAKIYLDLSDFDKAWDFGIKALGIRERVLGADHVETAFSYNSLARILMRQAKYAEAWPYSEQALRLREKVLKADHPHLADSYQQMGRLLWKMGSQQEGGVYLKRVLAIRERVMNFHPKMASILIDLGEWYRDQGDNAVARSHFEGALAILAGQVAEAHYDLRRVRRHLEG